MYHATVLNQPVADDRQLAAITTPAFEEATGVSDQIIDAVMARSIHVDVVRVWNRQ